MSEHATSRAFSVALGIGLLVLTAITVKAAFINLGAFNPVVAPPDRHLKATLVVLFFMHVKGASEKLTGVVVVAGFFFPRHPAIAVDGGLSDTRLAVVRVKY